MFSLCFKYYTLTFLNYQILILSGCGVFLLAFLDRSNLLWFCGIQNTSKEPHGHKILKDYVPERITQHISLG